MSNAILQGLTTIADEWRVLAVFWHAGAVLLFVVLALRCGTRQLVAQALTLPIFSVAALAWWSGNPFNGAVFGVTAVALLLVATRLPDAALTFARRSQVAGGAALCAYAWVYPHFLDGPWWDYLYQSPLGLIPCPTLLLVVGISLITESFQSTVWGLVVASISMAYGMTGVFVLGVGIDWILVVGAGVLAAHTSIRWLCSPDLVVLEEYRRTL